MATLRPKAAQKSAKKTERRIQLEDGRKIPFFWVASAVVEHHLWDIGPSAFAVYAVLCKHASNRTQLAWPCQQTIADLVGCSRTTVKEAIKTLITARLISVKQKGRPGREYNEYTLLQAAKIKGRTGSKSGRGQNLTGSKSGRAGSDSDRAGSKSGPELDVIELDESNKSKQVKHVCADAHDSHLASPIPEEELPVIPKENFINLVGFCEEYGMPLDERGRGSLRRLWAEAEFNDENGPDDRETVCTHALGEAFNHCNGEQSSVFVVALQIIRGEEGFNAA
jgi:biotin operon repressor